MFVYIIYKTTNIINGRVYIGSHLCKGGNINDDYLGSGTTIKSAIRKYGHENFVRETLETITSPKRYNNQDWSNIILPLETKWIHHFKEILGENVLYNINTGSAFGGNTTGNRYWINNGITQKMIYNDKPIPEGWSIGRIVGTVKQTNKNKKLHTSIITGEERYFIVGEPDAEWVIGSASQTLRLKHKNPAFGGKWLINHSTREKAFIKNEILRESLLSNGWCYGMRHSYQAVKP
jgi:hypothetical protein